MLFAMMGIGIVWGLPDLGDPDPTKNLDAPGGLGTPGGDQTDPTTTGEDPTTTDLDDDAGEGAGEGGKKEPAGTGEQETTTQATGQSEAGAGKTVTESNDTAKKTDGSPSHLTVKKTDDSSQASTSDGAAAATKAEEQQQQEVDLDDYLKGKGAGDGAKPAEPTTAKAEPAADLTPAEVTNFNQSINELFKYGPLNKEKVKSLIEKLNEEGLAKRFVQYISKLQYEPTDDIVTDGASEVYLYIKLNYDVNDGKIEPKPTPTTSPAKPDPADTKTTAEKPADAAKADPTTAGKPDTTTAPTVPADQTPATEPAAAPPTDPVAAKPTQKSGSLVSRFTEWLSKLSKKVSLTRKTEEIVKADLNNDDVDGAEQIVEEKKPGLGKIIRRFFSPEKAKVALEGLQEIVSADPTGKTLEQFLTDMSNAVKKVSLRVGKMTPDQLSQAMETIETLKERLDGMDVSDETLKTQKEGVQDAVNALNARVNFRSDNLKLNEISSEVGKMTPDQLSQAMETIETLKKKLDGMDVSDETLKTQKEGVQNAVNALKESILSKVINSYLSAGRETPPYLEIFSNPNTAMHVLMNKQEFYLNKNLIDLENLTGLIKVMDMMNSLSYNSSILKDLGLKSDDTNTFLAIDKTIKNFKTKEKFIVTLKRESNGNKVESGNFDDDQMQRFYEAFGDALVRIPKVDLYGSVEQKLLDRIYEEKENERFEDIKNLIQQRGGDVTSIKDNTALGKAYYESLTEENISPRDYGMLAKARSIVVYDRGNAQKDKSNPYYEQSQNLRDLEFLIDPYTAFLYKLHTKDSAALSNIIKKYSLELVGDISDMMAKNMMELSNFKKSPSQPEEGITQNNSPADPEGLVTRARLERLLLADADDYKDGKTPIDIKLPKKVIEKAYEILTRKSGLLKKEPSFKDKLSSYSILRSADESDLNDDQKEAMARFANSVPKIVQDKINLMENVSNIIEFMEEYKDLDALPDYQKTEIKLNITEKVLSIQRSKNRLINTKLVNVPSSGDKSTTEGLSPSELSPDNDVFYDAEGLESNSDYQEAKASLNTVLTEWVEHNTPGSTKIDPLKDSTGQNERQNDLKEQMTTAVGKLLEMARTDAEKRMVVDEIFKQLKSAYERGMEEKSKGVPEQRFGDRLRALIGTKFSKNISYYTFAQESPAYQELITQLGLKRQYAFDDIQSLLKQYGELKSNPDQVMDIKSFGKVTKYTKTKLENEITEKIKAFITMIEKSDISKDVKQRYKKDLLTILGEKGKFPNKELEKLAHSIGRVKIDVGGNTTFSDHTEGQEGPTYIHYMPDGSKISVGIRKKPKSSVASSSVDDDSGDKKGLYFFGYIKNGENKSIDFTINFDPSDVKQNNDSIEDLKKAAQELININNKEIELDKDKADNFKKIEAYLSKLRTISNNLKDYAFTKEFNMQPVVNADQLVNIKESIEKIKVFLDKMFITVPKMSKEGTTTFSKKIKAGEEKNIPKIKEIVAALMDISRTIFYKQLPKPYQRAIESFTMEQANNKKKPK